MLPAQYRMRRSTDFNATVKDGSRVVRPDLVIHVREVPGQEPSGPRIGLVVAKSVGTAVQRHRVARQLRHATRTLLTELSPSQQVVIRALPSSRHAISARLEQQLRTGLSASRAITGSQR